MSRRARLAGLLVSAALMVLGLPAAAAPPAAVPTPTITTPPAGTHGYPYLADTADLAAHGYTEQEFFLSGTATAYDKAGTWTADGHWGVTQGATAPYTTRILVRRPADPAKFTGTVVVEWLNVTGQIEAPADWLYEQNELARGDAWVGVSAQQVGVDDSLGALVGLPGLKQWDPQRYGALNHPGDQYSYDIFSQAAQALRDPHGPNPLGGLTPKRILGDGESQSALRLTTYVNAVAPLAHVFDGYLIHSNASSAAPIGQGTIELGGLIPRVRTDLGVPTFLLETETDVALNSSARQPDTPTVHTWEVAGTAHADRYLLETGLSEVGTSLGVGAGTDLSTLCGTGDAPINDGPGHYAADAALAALSRWAGGGPAPAGAPPLDIEGGALVRDPATGLAAGGVRLPDVTVPTRTISGQRGLTDLTSAVCSLFGSSDPWNGSTDAWDSHGSGDPSDPGARGVPEPSLAALYPTHAGYVAKVSAAARAAGAGGFLTPGDEAEIVAAAGASTAGG